MNHEYIVSPMHTFAHNIIVEASSSEEAIQKVHEMLQNPSPDNESLKELNYVTSLPTGEWPVERKKDAIKRFVESTDGRQIEFSDQA
jgi:hypothetical protein